MQLCPTSTCLICYNVVPSKPGFSRDRLAHAGISPKAIMMLAGHRHLSTTQRYIDVN
jgi:hypothetical protein